MTVALNINGIDELDFPTGVSSVSVSGGKATVNLTGGGGGSVTTTGSPASGNLTEFSGASSITNGDLSGDVTTSGTLACTVGKLRGASLDSTIGTAGSGQNGDVIYWDNPSTSYKLKAAGGSGTVTSVTFTGDGTVLSSTPSSAVTTAGTVAASLNNQTANTVLAGPTSGGAAAPTFRQVIESDLSLSNNTTNNASASRHGFLPILPNDNTKYLDGTGAFTAPSTPSSASSLFTKNNYPASSRVRGTAYQNTSGHDMIVSGWFLQASGVLVTATQDNSNPPTTVVNEQLSGAAFGVPFIFCVPNNGYYKIDGAGGTGTLEVVVEWQINSGTITFSGELSGSRALNTAYQNTSGNGMLVVVDIGSITNTSTVVQILSDTANPPTTVRFSANGTNLSSHLTAWVIVPNNHYYKVTSTTGSISHWNEYSLPFKVTAPTVDYGVTNYAQRTVSNVTTAGNIPVFPNLTSKDIWLQVVATNTNGSVNLQTYGGTSCTLPLGLHVNTVGVATGGQTGSALAQVNDFFAAAWNGGTGALSHWLEYILG